MAQASSNFTFVASQQSTPRQNAAADADAVRRMLARWIAQRIIQTGRLGSGKLGVR
jgi:hypothetical protein